MLAKLWRVRNGIAIKTFPLELLVIEVLKNENWGTLEERFRRVLEAFSDRIDELYIEDPANPTGNDMSHALTDQLRKTMAKVASNTIDAVETYGWEHVFGKLESRTAAIPRVEILRSSAAASAVHTRPWGPKK